MQTGGMLETLFHIVDVEYSWISALQGEEDSEPQFKDYQSIQKVKALSDLYKRELEVFFAVMII
ncbi:damage-inducible protein DinB [Bacillus thuringiensis]|uniref:Damage-inducible protein DinB n=2 Tax=Bacillus cereus group TaxID=86661 RepID=A0A9W5QUL3_BACCE|nr:hypothetical protein IGM_02968 [Bacillus cereus HuB4-4]PGK73936.1 damage-inducible protein DinB [Bacillus thuringiensis]